MLNKQDYQAIFSFWGVDYAQTCPEFKISGSPERSLFRTVAQNQQGNFFLFEEIDSASAPRKEQIANFIASLYHIGLEKIAPYLANEKGVFVQNYQGRFFQLSPFFIQTQPLPRPGFEKEVWRAKKLSAFLIQFREKSHLLDFPTENQSFDLEQYIHQIEADSQKNHPQFSSKIQTSVKFLEKSLFKKLPAIPRCFNHGDIHPLNILWSKDDLLAVIDWEFCGLKTENYDLANLIGTIGMENPNNFKSSFVKILIDDLKKIPYLSPIGWETLPLMILAIRFGWMAEWLRKEDLPMIKLELSYWEILQKNNQMLF